MLIPAREQNRLAAHDAAALQVEVEHVKKQIRVNRDFLGAVLTDPQLATRLALRQNAPIRPAGLAPLLLDGAATRSPFGQSPYAITYLPPPEPIDNFESDLGPVTRRWLIDPQRRAYATSTGAFLLAAALILGAIPTRNVSAA